MYKIIVWSIRDRQWRVVADNLNNEQAAKLWRDLCNNGMSPRVVKATQ